MKVPLLRGPAPRDAPSPIAYPTGMGKKGTSVLKRQRELKKAEKAAEKRERRTEQGGERKSGPQVASVDDLRGYGMVDEDEPPRKQPS